MTAQTPQPLTTEAVLGMIADRGAIPDIGQITDRVARDLNKLVRKGELAKYKGYWDTLLPFAGMGPLKTIYATPEVGAYMAEFAAARRAA